MSSNFKSLESTGKNVNSELKPTALSEELNLVGQAGNVGKDLVEWFQTGKDNGLSKRKLHHVELVYAKENKTLEPSDTATLAFREAAKTWGQKHKLGADDTNKLAELGEHFLSDQWASFANCIRDIPSDKYDRIANGFAEIVTSANRAAPTKVTVNDRVITFDIGSSKILIDCGQDTLSVLDAMGKKETRPQERKAAIEKLKDKAVGDFSTVSDEGVERLKDSERPAEKRGKREKDPPAERANKGLSKDQAKMKAIDKLAADLKAVKPSHNGEKVIQVPRGYDESMLDSVAQKLANEYKVRKGWGDNGLRHLFAVPIEPMRRK
jgi:hypothetical protein